MYFGLHLKQVPLKGPFEIIGTVKPEHDWTLNYEFNILQDDKIKRLKIWGLRYYKSSILISKYMGQLKKTFNSKICRYI